MNKVSSCCQLTHIPTGIQVKVQDTRDQNKNEIIAWERLEQKLSVIEEEKFDKATYDFRFDQIGNSNRGDKRRTYKVKEDMVVDHITGKRATFKEISKGKLEQLKK